MYGANSEVAAETEKILRLATNTQISWCKTLRFQGLVQSPVTTRLPLTVWVNSREQMTGDVVSTWGIGWGLITPCHKKKIVNVTMCCTGPCTRTDSSELQRDWNSTNRPKRITNKLKNAKQEQNFKWMPNVLRISTITESFETNVLFHAYFLHKTIKLYALSEIARTCRRNASLCDRLGSLWAKGIYVRVPDHQSSLAYWNK